AVVVRNDVVVAVAGVVAGAHPGHRRGLRARRAALHRAAAATAQEAVDGAVAPVLAGLRIARVGRATGRRSWRLAARHRQQRYGGSAEQQRAEAAEETP